MIKWFVLLFNETTFVILDLIYIDEAGFCERPRRRETLNLCIWLVIVFSIGLFTSLKISPVEAESTWVTYCALLNGFYLKSKPLILRLEQTKDKIGWYKDFMLFNNTHTRLKKYVILKEIRTLITSHNFKQNPTNGTTMLKAFSFIRLILNKRRKIDII